MADQATEALAYAALAVDAAARLPDIGADTKPRPVEAVGVIGGGTMGGGIALACAAAGLPVTLVELDAAGTDRARATIDRLLDEMRDKGRIDADERRKRGERIHVVIGYQALADADLIIEAVFEQMAAKRAVFRDLDALAKPGAILATNTSYLDIDRIAAETARPHDVLGLHFFSPANVMRLLEIVRAEETGKDVLATALSFARRIGKTPVVARVCHGFIGNRLLEGYIREAGLLMLEGAAPEAIDAAIRDFGYPMGPLEMGDLAGLDIGYMLRRQFPADRFDPNAYRVMNRLVEMGRKGQKTAAGIYRYQPGSRTPIPNPVTMAIIKEERQACGMVAREIGADEIVERGLMPLVNEGARILEEGIAVRSSDIDVVYLHGYGFPRWRGGPMYWADSLGLPHILERIEYYRRTQGARWWTPAPLLERLASAGRGFRDYSG